MVSAIFEDQVQSDFDPVIPDIFDFEYNIFGLSSELLMIGFFIIILKLLYCIDDRGLKPFLK